MAMLASKSPYPAPLGLGSGPTSTSYRNLSALSNGTNGVFASPTESEFSGITDNGDSVRTWDEERVAEWLATINCSQYADIFRRNNINGENLMDIDQSTLKDMGVKKIGDRVRIGSQAKVFRNREYRRSSKRSINRHSLAALDAPSKTPPSSASPRPQPPVRSAPPRDNRRFHTGADVGYPGVAPLNPNRSPSRPGTPQATQDIRTHPRHPGMSPLENARHEQSPSYFGHSSGGQTPQTVRSGGSSKPATTPTDTPRGLRFPHSRGNLSMDGHVTNSSPLPIDKALIRVIWDKGSSSVVNIEGCKTAEEVVKKTLDKGKLNEAHFKSYCFWVLDGINADTSLCRRLNESELLRVCLDPAKNERGRLMLRKIHAGEPDGEQLKMAANIALHQMPPINNTRSQQKIEKLTGESLAAVSYPLSPTSAAERERHVFNTAQSLERADSTTSTISHRARKLKELFGGRPPSEFITKDLSTFFPDVKKEEIDKTVRMSVRRSRRLSRAASRLSTASNFSNVIDMKNAPPIPNLPDGWVNGGAPAKGLRPLSIYRGGVGLGGSFRDSIASSLLEPLEEESASLEPNRKSYVSLGGSDSGNMSVTDPDGQTASMSSYFDDTGSSPAMTEAGGSWNSRLSQVLAEDDEESDEELINYLEKDQSKDIPYIKGELIGQGSFGSVYLALHAVTAELMAVKQVEMPSNAGSALDQKKNNMIEALKHEIGLLRALKHPHIVRYLGSNSDESHLNIFLEYVPGGSVASMLVNYGPLPEGLICNFVRQILSGLAYLHSKDIIHRDIKGANILVDNHGAVKISDFGISKRVEASTLLNGGLQATRKGTTAGGIGGAGARVSLQGSVFWMAPEVVKQTAYTRKADIWSLGCLIVEMFTGAHPHPNCTQLQAIFKIGGSGDASPTIPDHASDEARLFLRKTFEIDHEARPTADELLKSKFVAKGKQDV
ncbi:MAG: ATP binding [Bogoriella megaspora]|nr:MAG: ATP binding [Bogoriella megaspora]